MMTAMCVGSDSFITRINVEGVGMIGAPAGGFTVMSDDHLILLPSLLALLPASTLKEWFEEDVHHGHDRQACL